MGKGSDEEICQWYTALGEHGGTACLGKHAPCIPPWSSRKLDLGESNLWFVMPHMASITAWATLCPFAQFIGLCSRSKWSKHRTKSIFLAWLAMAGSNVAYKIISACSNTVR